MDQRANIFDSYREAFPIDTENPILSVIPAPFAPNEIPVPGAHLAGGECKRAQLLALNEPGVRFRECCGSLGYAGFELAVELLQLARLAIEFGKYLDLC